jgi:hypothetical protein
MPIGRALRTRNRLVSRHLSTNFGDVKSSFLRCVLQYTQSFDIRVCTQSESSINSRYQVLPEYHSTYDQVLQNTTHPASSSLHLLPDHQPSQPPSTPTKRQQIPSQHRTAIALTPSSNHHNTTPLIPKSLGRLIDMEKALPQRSAPLANV